MEPVLVLGIDTAIGLTVVRELGERGVEVHGIARGSDSVGLRSRYLAHAYRHGPRDEALLDLIERIGREHDVRLLMTVSESDILFLNEHAERLGRFRRLFMDNERMESVLDKDRTAQLAAEVGLRAPTSHVLAAPEELDAIAGALRYPVILKWAHPPAVAAGLARHGLPFHKAEYCYDEPGLRAALERYRPLGAYPLVQDFCPGHGLGQMIFLHEGEPLLTFEHRRRHEWPPEGGFSTLCESARAPETAPLMEKSVALLRRIGWEGAAMVEYRYDPETGEAVLMEVNGRFWGSQPLAYHAGAHFAWLTYSVLGRGEVPPVEPYRAGVRCKFGLPDLKRLLVICFRPGTIQNRALRFSKPRELAAWLLYFVRPSSRYYVFRWRDPLPFLADLAHIGRKAIAAGWRKLRRR